MMASARASAAEREQVYAKLQLSMAALQLDKLQLELDRQAAAEDEDDSLLDDVDMELEDGDDSGALELDDEDFALEDGDGSEAALVTAQVQTRSKQKSRRRARPVHGVRAGQSYGEIPVATVLEELEEAVANSSVFAGPAPQSQPFAGHRYVALLLR